MSLASYSDPRIESSWHERLRVVCWNTLDNHCRPLCWRPASCGSCAKPQYAMDHPYGVSGERKKIVKRALSIASVAQEHPFVVPRSRQGIERLPGRLADLAFYCSCNSIADFCW